MTASKPVRRPQQMKCGFRNCRVMFTPNPNRPAQKYHSANCRIREWQARHYFNPAEIDRLKKRIAELETGSDNSNQ